VIVGAGAPQRTVGVVGLVVDSYGMLSIAVDRGSAADELQVRAGDQVTLAPVDDGDEGDAATTGISTAVTLGSRLPR